MDESTGQALALQAKLKRRKFRPPVPRVGEDAPSYDQQVFLTLARRGRHYWNEWRARHPRKNSKGYIRVTFANVNFRTVEIRAIDSPASFSAMRPISLARRSGMGPNSLARPSGSGPISLARRSAMGPISLGRPSKMGPISLARPSGMGLIDERLDTFYQHRARLSLESREGGGTCVTLIMPRLNGVTAS